MSPEPTVARVRHVVSWAGIGTFLLTAWGNFNSCQANQIAREAADSAKEAHHKIAKEDSRLEKVGKKADAAKDSSDAAVALSGP